MCRCSPLGDTGCGRERAKARQKWSVKMAQAENKKEAKTKRRRRKKESNLMSSNPSKRWWWRQLDCGYIWKGKTTEVADGLDLEVKEIKIKDHRRFRPEELER